MERVRRSRLVSVVVAVAFASTIPSTAAATSSWHPIATAPIPGRLGAGVVWTGHRMIVWGGVSGTYGKEARRDGAIYDPVADRWHRIRSAPAGVIGGGGQGAAWTGKRAVFWAGNSRARRAAPSTTRGPTVGGGCRAGRSALERDTSPRGPGRSSS